MIFSITLSLLTLAGALFFSHIKIKRSRDYILDKTNFDIKKIEDEVNKRLRFIEDKQVQSLKILVEQIESKQRTQQEILENIKTQLVENNNENIKSEVQTIQCQVQELTHHMEELKKISEVSSKNHFSYEKIRGLDEIDELSRAAKQHCHKNNENDQLISIAEIKKADDEIIAVEKHSEYQPDSCPESNQDQTDCVEKIETCLTDKPKLDWLEKTKNNLIKRVEIDSLITTNKSESTTVFRAINYEPITKNLRNLQLVHQTLRPAHRSIDKSESKTPQALLLYPNILAFHRSGQWEFFVEIPDKISDQEKIINVVQGETTFSRQEDGLFGPLLYIDTAIEIYSEKSEKRIKTLIGLISTSNPVLIFRLIEDKNDWKGTLILSPSKGFYLVIAPTNWRRDEESGGYAPVDPEPLKIAGLTAHYFDIQGEEAIIFIKPDEKQYKKKPKKVDFILTGQYIDDAEERMGPLFFGEMPNISGDSNSWKEIRSIVIGEEGQGEGQWCERHDTTIFAKRSWPITSLGPKGNSGWFFVRFYDYNGQLVNSLPFRFVRGLKNIQAPVSVFPGYRNERPARLEFSITDQIHVNPPQNSPKLERETDTRNHKITFISKPSPTTKKLTFQIQENQGRPVRVSFDVDRLWWRIRNEQMAQDSVEWSSALLEKAKSAFSPTANEVLELHLPLPLVKQPVKVGFQREKALNLQVSIKEQIGKAPLHWFYDEVTKNDIEKKELGIWIGQNQDSPYYKILECITHTTCPHCAEIFEEKSALLDHHLNEHDTQLFQNLMIKRDRELGFLPRKLYVCLYDGMFFAGDPIHRDCFPKEMENHFRNEHPNDRMSFRVIDDPDAIQRIRGYKLEQVWKCVICEDILVPPSDDSSARSVKRLHLLSKHQHYIYQQRS